MEAGLLRATGAVQHDDHGGTGTGRRFDEQTGHALTCLDGEAEGGVVQAVSPRRLLFRRERHLGAVDGLRKAVWSEAWAGRASASTETGAKRRAGAGGMRAGCEREGSG